MKTKNKKVKVKTEPLETELETDTLRVSVENLLSNPECPHGPTLLFTRKNKRFFACSAYRDRKGCQFYQHQNFNKISKATQGARRLEKLKLLEGINHRKAFEVLIKMKSIPLIHRAYCHDCKDLFDTSADQEHKDHSSIVGLSDHDLKHPSEILKPLEDNKGEAQYLFAKDTVKFIVDTFERLDYKYVICMGTPRIHEYIQSEKKDMHSVLLDLDHRFHRFFGPGEFCWYNMFNNYFFLNGGGKVFDEFLKTTRGQKTVLITDPPFGGRIEPLAHTLNTINNTYKSVNQSEEDLAMFFIFPYFMEPQMLNSLTTFKMLDYQVDYDNHTQFQTDDKERQNDIGSPIRIFTNVNPSLIELPENNYKFCEICDRWVLNANKHCDICGECTSKNGQTYKHCKKCKKCVKLGWKHCMRCDRCIVNKKIGHKCGLKIKFKGKCANCKKRGHKKTDCPNQATTKKEKGKLPKSEIKKEYKGNCTNCGNQGHKKKDCPNLDRPAAKKNNLENGNNEKVKTESLENEDCLDDVEKPATKKENLENGNNEKIKTENVEKDCPNVEKPEKKKRKKYYNWKNGNNKKIKTENVENKDCPDVKKPSAKKRKKNNNWKNENNKKIKIESVE